MKCYIDMDPDDIVLNNTSQMFQYEKMSRDIEDCDDVEIGRAHV